MNKLMMSAAAVAVCLGSSAAFAQDTSKTTTTTSTPEGTTQTTVTKTSDGYKQYTRTETATKHYNAGVYVGPSGYSYSRYTVGMRAPSMFLGGHYEIGHYSTYGLETPPMGLTWIRVGDDALLIDGNTGEVVQADYGLFAN
ncbi:MAG TPA: RcnB family protein [Rhizomicrobium sp.]|nr:RcnB family protein [Rhizomicrobium sp.]